MNDFHDWTLLELQFEWQTGDLSLKLRGPESEQVLYFRDVSEITCSRKFEWGRSASIGKLFSVMRSGREEIMVEMQSGDVIAFVASASPAG